MNMSVNIAGVEWKNPVTVASGTFGSGEEFSEFVDLNRLGAVTTKGVANVPWAGNPTPRVAEVDGGMMKMCIRDRSETDEYTKVMLLFHDTEAKESTIQALPTVMEYYKMCIRDSTFTVRPSEDGSCKIDS